MFDLKKEKQYLKVILIVLNFDDLRRNILPLEYIGA